MGADDPRLEGVDGGDAMLTLQRTELDDAVGLEVQGEIDAHTAGRVTEAVADTLHTGSVTSLVLDLRQVTFIDSSGLRALVDAKVTCEQERVSLMISGMSPQVKRILEVSGLAQLFPTVT
jgi:anti-anti-sigma factor